MAPFMGSDKKDTQLLNARARVRFDDARFLTISVHTIELVRNMLQKMPSQRPKARVACDAITLFIEYSAAALSHSPPQTLEQDTLRPGRVADQDCSRASKSMSSRLHAVSRLISTFTCSSFSLTSSASSSGFSAFAVPHAKAKAKAKPQAKKFFLKAGQLLDRVRHGNPQAA
eukprot:TRINITY_DN9722_c0_g1_i1.p1 TRINITY_DN9722_c0_g1~~TRINITY_DN9722_c0_g1_i1.p1  ORF type:complete len:202 (-),score=9.88 TRINITY_DN9722_c0_g1_i1:256-771(-)